MFRIPIYLTEEIHEIKDVPCDEVFSCFKGLLNYFLMPTSEESICFNVAFGNVKYDKIK